MGSTKIINVLKDDKFDELLDIFKETTAEEIVFILPKRTKALNKEEHFIILSKEAKNLDKSVSIMCTSPTVNELAEKYKFGVLAKDIKTKTITAKAVSVPPQDPAIHDDSEAYESDVVVPSDETTGIDHGEEVDEEENMHIEEDLDKPDQEQPSEPVEAELETYEAEPRHEYEAVTAAKALRGAKKLPKSRINKIKTDMEGFENVWRKEVQGTSVWSGILKKKGNFWNRLYIPKVRLSLGDMSSKKLISGLVVSSFLLLGLIIYVSSGSAQIIIKPVEKKLTSPIKIDVSDSFASSDPVFNKLPGQLINVEKTIQQDFPATSQKEVAQKARGKIIVYNNYGTSSQTLIATTRFESAAGLIFRTLKTIVVPGTKVENGKIIPGSINVEVIADKPGQNYNIPAGKFTIPAFKEKGDTDRYEKFYGESTVAMTGGMIGKALVVSEADYNKAKDAVVAKLKDDIQESAKAEAAGLKIINAGSVDIKSLTSTAQPDQAAEQFTVTAVGSLKTIGFKEGDLLSLISQSVQRGSNLIVLPEKVSLDYKDIVFSDSNNVLTFNVFVNGNLYVKVDPMKIIADLAGKTEMEFNDYLAHVPGIAHSNVSLSPRWAKTMPDNPEKIKVEIKY